MTNNHYSAIELHIEELALEGFAPGDRYRIADALQHELARLLTAQGLSFSRDAAMEHLNVSAAVNPRAPGASNGAEIARAVYEGLNAKP